MCNGAGNNVDRRPKAQEHFMRFVETTTDGCWLWTGSMEPGPSGYGRYTMAAGYREWAHRAAYWLFVGPIPYSQCVLHSCDVRHCVRPSHLFLGTRTDNAADRDAKGRTSRGSKHSEAIRAAWARRKQRRLL